MTLRCDSLIIVAALLSMGACGGTSTDEPFPASCHLPSPGPGVDADLVPASLVLEGAVARDSAREGGLVYVAFNVPMGLDDAYDRYLDLLDEDPYSLLNSENEGFEAELYGRNAENDDAVAVQMRRPGCDEAVSIVVTVGRVTDPTGKGSGG